VAVRAQERQHETLYAARVLMVVITTRSVTRTRLVIVPVFMAFRRVLIKVESLRLLYGILWCVCTYAEAPRRERGQIDRRGYARRPVRQVGGHDSDHAGRLVNEAVPPAGVLVVAAAGGVRGIRSPTDGIAPQAARCRRERCGLGDRELGVHPGGVVVGEVADKLVLSGRQGDGHPA
jgi:hypothetical protein